MIDWVAFVVRKHNAGIQTRTAVSRNSDSAGLFATAATRGLTIALPTRNMWSIGNEITVKNPNLLETGHQKILDRHLQTHICSQVLMPSRSRPVAMTRAVRSHSSNRLVRMESSGSFSTVHSW